MSRYQQDTTIQVYSLWVNLTIKALSLKNILRHLFFASLKRSTQLKYFSLNKTLFFHIIKFCEK